MGDHSHRLCVRGGLADLARLGTDHVKGCRATYEVTDEHRARCAEVAANGGTLTAEETAHTDAFECKGNAWEREHAEAWIKAQQTAGKWQDAHAHDDGTVWIPRR